jgi:glycerophosphoryl diester phosphodiesterase
MLELIPSVRTGILQVAYPIDSSAAMRSAGATDLWQHVDFIDERLVSDVHAYGGKLIAWTANTTEQWQSLTDLGVDGICTDHVDRYVEWRGEPAAAD